MFTIDKQTVKSGLTKTSDRLVKIGAVIGALTVIAGGYTWWLNNFWKPEVEITFVDFTKGEAKIRYKKKIIDLIGDSVFWINADWGVRFGNIIKDGKITYNRIELVKKGMVVEYVAK